MFNLEEKVYNHKGEFVKAKEADLEKGFKEHCDYKDAPCNYNGWGWYDRCVWCKDNNGFKRKNSRNDKTRKNRKGIY